MSDLDDNSCQTFFFVSIVNFEDFFNFDKNSLSVLYVKYHLFNHISKTAEFCFDEVDTTDKQVIFPAPSACSLYWILQRVPARPSRCAKPSLASAAENSQRSNVCMRASERVCRFVGQNQCWFVQLWLEKGECRFTTTGNF